MASTDGRDGPAHVCDLTRQRRETATRFRETELQLAESLQFRLRMVMDGLQEELKRDQVGSKKKA